MKTFKQHLNEIKDPTGKLKDACWKGYTAVGTKQKNGKTVPNCVPVKEDGGAMGGSAGPTNAVGGGAIAGTGGAGGEPGVHMKKKKTPIVMPMGRRKPPTI